MRSLPWGSSDLELLRLLRDVRVRTAGEHMELPEHLPAEDRLRQHALDGILDRALRVLFEKLAERHGLQVAEIAGMLLVELVAGLVAGDRDLLGVDHDDVI